MRLTLGQSRFVAEHLRLRDADHLLRHHPLGFLDALVKAFRYNVDYGSVHYVSQKMAPGGRWRSLTPDVLEATMLEGRAVCCCMVNSFLVDLLRAYGFDADLIVAFPASTPRFLPEAGHVAARVRHPAVTAGNNVGSFVYCDAGSMVPIRSAVHISRDAPTPELDDGLARYRFVGRPHVENFTREFHDKIATPLLDRARQMVTRLDIANQDRLLTFVSNSRLMSVAIPQFSSVPDGTWVPYHLFPTLSPMGDRFRRSWANDEELFECGRRMCYVTGYSRRTGEFVSFSRDERARSQAEGGAAKVTKSTSPRFERNFR